MPPRRRKPAEPLAPGRLLDWSEGHWSREPGPCRYCGGATNLRDSKRVPAHKVCAEAAFDKQRAEAAEAYRARGLL